MYVWLTANTTAKFTTGGKKKNKKNKPKKALDTSTANSANDGTGTAEPSPRDSNRELSADEEPDTPVVS